MTTSTLRVNLINEVKRMLGGSMIDRELDAEDYELAATLALERYNLRSGNAQEEAYMFLELVNEEGVYYLPQEIISVRQIFRRGLGETNGGSSVDPFSLAYTNLYLLQAGAGGGYTAGLLTYEAFNQFLKQAGRMFGAYLNYTYNTVTKKLQLVRKPTGGEAVLLWVYKTRTEDELLSDPFARPWIRNYTLAWSKQMLGEAYEKYATIIGPQGGTTLNGAALKNDAKEMMDKLEIEMQQYTDNSMPLSIIIG
tara:strand:- start:35034 stop:35789 length:756 start_codon:yes stop_codon:yes gene_type:complete